MTSFSERFKFAKRGAAALFEFVKSDIGRLLLGLILSPLIGNFILARYQQGHWERQTKLEAFSQKSQSERERKLEIMRWRLNNGERALDAIADAASARLSRMDDVVTAIEGNDVAATEKAWDEYRLAALAWDASRASSRARLSRLVGVEKGSVLDKLSPPIPNGGMSQPDSIEERFRRVDRKLERIVRCLDGKRCVSEVGERRALSAELGALHEQIFAFESFITTLFLRQVSRFEKGQMTPADEELASGFQPGQP